MIMIIKDMLELLTLFHDKWITYREINLNKISLINTLKLLNGLYYIYFLDWDNSLRLR